MLLSAGVQKYIRVRSCVYPHVRGCLHVPAGCDGLRCTPGQYPRGEYHAAQPPVWTPNFTIPLPTPLCPHTHHTHTLYLTHPPPPTPLRLQKPPTAGWSEKDVELVLSRAFMWRASFKDATSHFS